MYGDIFVNFFFFLYFMFSELICSLILQVHGLLHVIGFDHELGPDDSQEMEDKETQILSKLGWKGKGLISAVSNSVMEESNGSTTSGGAVVDGLELLMIFTSYHYSTLR